MYGAEANNSRPSKIQKPKTGTKEGKRGGIWPRDYILSFLCQGFLSFRDSNRSAGIARIFPPFDPELSVRAKAVTAVNYRHMRWF